MLIKEKTCMIVVCLLRDEIRNPKRQKALVKAKATFQDKKLFWCTREKKSGVKQVLSYMLFTLT